MYETSNGALLRLQKRVTMALRDMEGRLTGPISDIADRATRKALLAQEVRILQVNLEEVYYSCQQDLIEDRHERITSNTRNQM